MRIPHTPFATRLSGSAKETELRLRSIFQWKKKRPPIILFVLVAVVLIAVCGGLFGFSQPETSDERYLALLETENARIYGEKAGFRRVKLYWQPNGGTARLFCERDRMYPSTLRLTEDNGILNIYFTDSLRDYSCVLMYALSEEKAPEYLRGGMTTETDAAGELEEHMLEQEGVRAEPEATMMFGPEGYGLYWLVNETDPQLLWKWEVREGEAFQIETVSRYGYQYLLVYHERSGGAEVETRIYSFSGTETPVYLTTTSLRSECVDLDGEGEDELSASYGYYEFLPEGSLLYVRPEWTRLSDSSYVIAQTQGQDRLFQLVLEEREVVLYQTRDDGRQEIARYPADNGGGRVVFPAFTGMMMADDSGDVISMNTDLLYENVLGHPGLKLIHTLGGRYMIDLYAVDVEMPYLLASVDEEATRQLDLDRDGVNEFVFCWSQLYAHDQGIPFCYIYTRGEDGTPRCADLAQVWPEYGTYGRNNIGFNSLGDLYLREEQSDAVRVLLTGSEIMEIISEANGWSGEIPGWDVVTAVAGPRIDESQL